MQERQRKGEISAEQGNCLSGRMGVPIFWQGYLIRLWVGLTSVWSRVQRVGVGSRSQVYEECVFS